MDQGSHTDTIADAARENIIVGIDADRAIVSINRIEKRNALSLSMWRQLSKTFTVLGKNRQIRTIILTGAGNSFCAGADISEFAKLRASEQQILDYESAVSACNEAIATVPKPTIAVVNGHCMGGGCGIAMACDFRYAHPSSTFGIPAARLSIIYGTDSTRRLLALVGPSAAKQILYSAQTFDAHKALGMGLIDQMCNDPLAKAQEFCAQLAKSAPLTISATKTLIDGMAAGETLSPATVHHIMSQALKSKDYQEGRMAFMEKRPPVFHGL